MEQHRQQIRKYSNQNITAEVKTLNIKLGQPQAFNVLFQTSSHVSRGSKRIYLSVAEIKLQQLVVAHYKSLSSAAVIVLAGDRCECIISDGKSNVPDTARAELQGTKQWSPEGKQLTSWASCSSRTSATGARWCFCAQGSIPRQTATRR